MERTGERVSGIESPPSEMNPLAGSPYVPPAILAPSPRVLAALGRRKRPAASVPASGAPRASGPSPARDRCWRRHRGVVPLRKLHLEQLGILAAAGLVAHLSLEAHADRVGRVEPDHLPVLDVDAGDAVAGRGQDEGRVETELERAGLDCAVPVDEPRPEAQVPFPHHARRLPRGLEDGGERGAPRLDDERRVAREDAGPLLPPGELARQEPVARGRAE